MAEPDPSQPLKNTRQELFAQGMARGLENSDAYAEAGYVRSSQNASKLKATPHVAARIRWLQQEAAGRAQVGIDDWLARILEVVGGNLVELFERSKQGALQVRDLTQLTKQQQMLIKKITIHDGEYGQTVQIEAYDRMKALDMLGKFLGAFEADNLQRLGPQEHQPPSGVPSSQLHELRARVLARIGQAMDRAQG